jgi:hypothetical protein
MNRPNPHLPQRRGVGSGLPLGSARGVTEGGQLALDDGQLLLDVIER